MANLPVLLILLHILVTTTSAAKDVLIGNQIQQPTKPDFNSFINYLPQLPSVPSRLSQLSHNIPQIQQLFGNHHAYPNRVLSYGPTPSFGYNNGGGYSYNNGFTNYMFPSSYQNYLFDPYLSASPYSSFGSFHPNPGYSTTSFHGSPFSKPNSQQLHHQQLQQQSLSPTSNLMSPPFGFLSKQLRNPNENPEDFVKFTPPKAIMTTASDMVGLRGQEPDPDTVMSSNTASLSSPFSYLFSPNKNTGSKSSSTDSKESSTKKRQYALSFTNLNQENPTHFHNKNRLGTGEGLLKSKLFGKKGASVKNAIKVKSINGTEIEIALDELEDDDEPNNKHNNFVSEPIIPDSQLSSTWSLNVKHGGQESEQPYNILPTYDDYLLRQPLHIDSQDPTPLFTTDYDGNVPAGVVAAEDDKYDEINDKFDFDKEPTELDNNNGVNNDESISNNNKNKRVYHCPTSRDLRELAQAEIYPDPFKCDQFYYCKWGKAYVFKCPINRFFNPYLKACDVDEDFACAMSLNKKKK